MVEVADIAPPPVVTDRGEGFGEDPVYFCDDCPFKGDADGVITGAMVWTYGVGLNRSGAAGALEDANGNYSKPIDLPFKGRERKSYTGSQLIQDPPEYWPDRLPFDLEVDKDGVIETVGKCEGPEISQTRFLKRETRHCPAIVARMMSRRTRRVIENTTTSSVITEE